jgi:NAD(P)-dependent dehydrogenase (short-subunit alcohol dehydrogenase family)
MAKGEFDGQVAAVTGAAAGIGNAIAKLLAAHGARICLIDIDGAAAQTAAKAMGGDTLAVVADVTDEVSVTAARDRVLETCGQVDILINNAGIYPQETIDDMTVASWDRVFDVNAKSVFLCTRAFGEPMRKAGYGRIVSIVTIDAYIAKPTMPHYAASKAAVASLIKTFALDFAPDGVLVNGVSPGAVATERAKSQDWLPKRIAEIPVRRAAEPEDIAEVVRFLASPRNRFVVGETIVASGGALML